VFATQAISNIKVINHNVLDSFATLPVYLAMEIIQLIVQCALYHYLELFKLYHMSKALVYA